MKRVLHSDSDQPGGSGVRVVGPDEWRVWRDVRLRALADAPEAFGASWTDWAAAGEPRWRQRLIEVPFNAIAIADDLEVGQASGTAIGNDQRIELISMWVAPQVRGFGVAANLIEAVAEYGRMVDAVAVRLSVKRVNERAIHCYRRAGFVHVDEPGDEESEIAMERLLPG